MALDDTIIIIILTVVAAVAIAACIALVVLMRKRTPKAAKPAKDSEIDPILAGPNLPLKISKSVQSTDAVHAKDELRILELEREILGDAIRHLYEAHAEGKISEQEREKLASSYKQRMLAVKESMAKDETIVALHELEGMQEDLMKMFSERFGELTGKVEELRSRIDVKPIKEIKVQMPRTQTLVAPDQMEKDEEEEPAEEGEEKAAKKPQKKPSVERKPQKTEAEQRIDAIRNQIDEVMNKLGQIEVDT